MPCLSKYLRILNAVQCKSLKLHIDILFIIVSDYSVHGFSTPNLTMSVHSSYLIRPCFCNIYTRFDSVYELHSRAVIDHAFQTPN